MSNPRALWWFGVLLLVACPPPPVESAAEPAAEPAAGPADSAPPAGARPSEPMAAPGTEAAAESAEATPSEAAPAAASPFGIPEVPPPECRIPPEAQDEAAREAGTRVERTARRLEQVRFEPRSLRSLGNDVSAFKDRLLEPAREITRAALDLITEHPCAVTWGLRVRYRAAWGWFTVWQQVTGMGERIPPEWSAMELASGATLLEMLTELGVGFRAVEVDGIRLEDLVRCFLVGDGGPGCRGVVGALPFARSFGAQDEWTEKAEGLRAAVEAAWWTPPVAPSVPPE